MTTENVGKQGWNCQNCGAPVALDVLERWWVTKHEDHDPHEWLVGKCAGCESPFVLFREADPDWQANHHMGIPNEEMPFVQLFPVTHRALSMSVPPSVRRSYDEAVECFRVGAFTAAVLMARRTVEVTCFEQGYRQRNLGPKLKKMLEDQGIDKRLFEWSSVVKDLGNAGAHESTVAVTRQDADDAISFSEAFASYLYTFARRYDEHVQRTRDG